MVENGFFAPGELSGKNPFFPEKCAEIPPGGPRAKFRDFPDFRVFRDFGDFVVFGGIVGFWAFMSVRFESTFR